MDKEKIKKFIIKWNTNFPIDRWWREKHKVSFNSPVHREVSFLSQYIEYLEDKMYLELENKEKIKYIPNAGDFMKYKKEEYTEEDLDQFKKEASDIVDKLQKVSL